MACDPELVEAYCNTSYRIPELEIELRVGQHSPQIDALLRRYGKKRWVFISASHPRSVLTEDEINQRQHAALRRCIEVREYPFFEGVGIGDKGDWPPERSLLVLGLSLSKAQFLCQQFGQNAFLTGRPEGQAELVWCQPKA